MKGTYLALLYFLALACISYDAFIFFKTRKQLVGEDEQASSTNEDSEVAGPPAVFEKLEGLPPFIPFASATIWKKIKFDFKDDNISFPFCNMRDWQCKNYTNYPAPRSGHSALIYKTYSKNDCRWYLHRCYDNQVVRPRDQPECLQKCEQTDSVIESRLAAEQKLIGLDVLRPWTNVTTIKNLCPSLCCQSDHEECETTIDNTGQSILQDEEIMLVFGGISSRSRYINNTKVLLFDECEAYDEEYEIDMERRPESFKTCSEEILDDIWRYHISRNAWSFVKIDYNRNEYASLQSPAARYGHATCYIEIPNPEEIMNDGKEFVRKYMYIYGGFSYECTTACYDLWRYEIPYFPIRMAPYGQWKNRGNHWQQLQDDATYGPGKRFKVSMVPYQRSKEENNGKEENYIYLFGGIKIANKEDRQQLSEEEQKYDTSFVFMSDLWRYELITNQWEVVEVYGISIIKRDLYLWNGTRVTMDVETVDRLADDKNLTHYEQQTDDAEKNAGIRLPTSRGGHMMTIIGNPRDYVMVFGGTSDDKLTDPEDLKAGVPQIKTTLADDFWVFNIRSKRWLPIFPNSEENPGPSEWGSMISLKDDRMALMFGGQYTEFLRDELWLYNLNTNLWQKTNIADKGHREPNFFYNCYRCEKCNYCKNETNYNQFRTEGETIKIERKRCTTCTPCQTTDKELEDLSLYHQLDPTKTTCQECANCMDYDDEQFLKIQEDPEGKIDHFDVCQECSLCTDCKNGLELKSPPGLRGHSMVIGDAGVLIYGGTHWTKTNHTIQDTDNERAKIFKDLCNIHVLEMSEKYVEKNKKLNKKWKPISYEDIGRNEWLEIWNDLFAKNESNRIAEEERLAAGTHDQSNKSEGLDFVNPLVLQCFNMTRNPPFLGIKRDVRYSSDIYFLSTSQCEDDCNDNGLCSISRCTCDNGWHGDACDKLNCPNSLCYVDIDTLEIQYCSHCSQNGRCITENQTCNCIDIDTLQPNGYYGKDCSLKGCLNDCGNVPGEMPVGECIQDFPTAYCRCFEENRRGGDDCSEVFCLNNCSRNGNCTEGVCQCENNYLGEDCSVFVNPIFEGGQFFLRKRVVLAVLGFVAFFYLS